MNFDFITCQDHKIKKSSRVKTTLKSQKSVLKKMVTRNTTMPQRAREKFFSFQKTSNFICKMENKSQAEYSPTSP